MQVRGPSHSMCWKIMWQLDFRNNMLIYVHYSDFWGHFVELVLFILKPWSLRCDVERGSRSRDGTLTIPQAVWTRPRKQGGAWVAMASAGAEVFGSRHERTFPAVSGS